MIAEWTPMRWPSGWSAASLDFLKGTTINCILVPGGGGVAVEARQRGLTVVEGDKLPAGVSMLKGAWPGVRMSRGGGASAGPTGTAWVDTNGWKVRLEHALHPDSKVWIEAEPDPQRRLHADAYVVAFADSAAYGGRWVISLDDRLAAGIASGNTESLKTWKSLTETAGLFARYSEWAKYEPAALVGVMSDFAGKNLFPNQELVNLLGRAGQQYRIVLKKSDASLSGLRAVIYNDGEAPTAELRDRILDFVRAGGLLITGQVWGEAGEVLPDEHPRYVSYRLGKGRIAIAKARVSDPYLLANDSEVLISHRYDLVRLWNCGSAGSYLTVSPDGKKALAHLLFYANEGPDSASVRIVGNYKKARLATVGSAGLQGVPVTLQQNAIEVHLPPVPQYIALELEG
jgi:hypothetical protein